MKPKLARGWGIPAQIKIDRENTDVQLCWDGLNPRIPYEFLPDVRDGVELEPENYMRVEGPMKLIAGQIVWIKGRDVNVKEYIDRGLYQGNDAKTGDLVHFVIEQVEPWIVEQKLASGWADAEWTENEEPRRFNTKEEAEEAIDEFIHDAKLAIDDGVIDMTYERESFRVVPVED